MREPTGDAWKRGEDKPRTVDVGVGAGERTKQRRADGRGDVDAAVSAALRVMGGSTGVSETRTSCHPC